ncbi:MAG: RNase P subunit p30 family protein [Nanoarchaeota archaeon]
MQKITDNFLFMPKSSELQLLSRKLGFSRTLFLGDFTCVEEKDKKNLLKEISRIKQKGALVIYRASGEEALRFVLEKTSADIILGMENIHSKDSLHYIRGGLDQILCTAAAVNDKTIGFSFSEILNSAERAKLLSRIMFNIRLCRKYKVKMLFSTFAASEKEMRSAKDLEAFWRVLNGLS